MYFLDINEFSKPPCDISPTITIVPVLPMRALGQRGSVTCPIVVRGRPLECRSELPCQAAGSLSVYSFHSTLINNKESGHLVNTDSFFILVCLDVLCVSSSFKSHLP